MANTATKHPAWWHVFRLTNRRQRWRTLAWGGLNAVLIAIMALAYDQAYPDPESAAAILELVGSNAAFAVLMGTPGDLSHAGGFVSWRLSLMAVLIAVWALLTTTMLLRGDEDTNRWELIVTGTISRGVASVTVMTSIVMQLALMWAMMALAGVLYGLDAYETMHFAAAYLMPAAVFIGVGALTSQLFETRRSAASVAGTVLMIALLVRMAVDGLADSSDWLWATPLGWYYLANPFNGPVWGPIVAGFALAGLLIVVSMVLARYRDMRGAVLPSRRQRASSMRMLSSPGWAALRQAKWSMFVWITSAVAYAVVIGMIAQDFADFLDSQEGFAEFVALLTTPSALVNTFFGMMFAMIALVVSMYAVLQLGGIVTEEVRGRLDMLFTQPVGRVSWMVQRLAVIVLGTVLLALSFGVFLWVGAAGSGVDASLGDLMLGSINMLWPAAFFVGVGVLLIGFAPRLAVAGSMGLLVITFVWSIVVELLDVPDWASWFSPFTFVEPVPAEDMNVTAAVALVVIGLVLSAIGTWQFTRRDITPD